MKVRLETDEIAFFQKKLSDEKEKDKSFRSKIPKKKVEPLLPRFDDSGESSTDNISPFLETTIGVTMKIEKIKEWEYLVLFQIPARFIEEFPKITSNHYKNIPSNLISPFSNSLFSIKTKKLTSREATIFFSILQEMWKDNLKSTSEFRRRPQDQKSRDPTPTETYDGEALSDMLINLKNGSPGQQDRYAKICDHFSTFFPSYQLICSEFQGKITVHVIDKDLGQEFPIDQVGGGLFEILFFIANLTSLSGKVFFLEEPEHHLHPSAQKDLMNLLNSFSQNNQIFVLTHSPFFLNISQMDASIFRIHKSNLASIVQGVNLEGITPIFSDIGVRPEDFLLSNGLILVEGKDDISFYRLLLKDILDKFHLNIQQLYGKNSIALITGAGFIQALTSKGFQFLIVLDKGAANQGIIERIRDEAIKERILLLPIWEVENFYLNPQMLGRYFLHNNGDRFQNEKAAVLFAEKAVKESLTQEIKWEALVKTILASTVPFLRDEYCKQLVKNSTESDLYQCVQSLLKENYHLDGIEKTFFKNAFEQAQTENEQYPQGEVWKKFPGKEIKKQLQQILKKEGVRFDINEMISFIRSDPYVITEIIKKVEAIWSKN